MKAFEGSDWTPEECFMFEHALFSRPNGQKIYAGILEWLDYKIGELQAEGQTVSCYSEAAEHALHPDGYGWADSTGSIPAQRVGTNQVVTPEVA